MGLSFTAASLPAPAPSGIAAPARALRHVALPPLPLEGGGALRQARIAFHLDGRLSDARDNVVLVLHALTGSADAAGDWWRGLIGDGAAIDTTRHAVLAPNLLGSRYGSSGPHDLEGFPALTVRDQARAIGVLLEQLRIPRIALVTGGSLGGMVALEFVASFPGRAERAAVFAAPARLGAGAIAWSHVQRRLLETHTKDGLALARQVAMLSYRAAPGLASRFGRARTDAGAFGVQDWLDAHGRRFVDRFDARTYRGLLDTMDAHDLECAHGGVAERLRGSGTRLTGVGIPGDLFCPPEEVRAWVDAAGGRYRELTSPHGHDAFLIERAQVAALLGEALAA